jgi:hypothetical protein
MSKEQGPLLHFCLCDYFLKVHTDTLSLELSLLAPHCLALFPLLAAPISGFIAVLPSGSLATYSDLCLPCDLEVYTCVHDAS